MAKSFRELLVWQKGIQLVVLVYRLSKQFPREETYGLSNQMRRSAVSIPSNIAEGQAHFSRAEFVHFLRHSSGSLAELETQLLIAQRLEYADQAKVEALLKQVVEVGKILNGLINSLKK